MTENLKAVEKKIDKACQQWNVDRKSIELIAVSKKQPDEKINAMLDAGHLIYGENRVQDAKARWGHRKEKNDTIKLHLIGPLQSNKAKEAVELFEQAATQMQANKIINTNAARAMLMLMEKYGTGEDGLKKTRKYLERIRKIDSGDESLRTLSDRLQKVVTAQAAQL